MAETVAEVLRGLAQSDLAKLAPEDPNDRFAAAYPNFQRFLPAGTATYRDDAVLLRRSVATVPTARMLGAMPGGLSVWDEEDIPAVFRALNPITNPSDRGFPTFTYGMSRGKRFMNVVQIRSGPFRIAVAPDTTPAMGDPTMVVAMFSGAYFFARSKGFKAGFPTFNRIPLPGTSVLGNEVVVFPGDSSGVVVASESTGLDFNRWWDNGIPPSWSFESVPVLTDEYSDRSGFAMAAIPSITKPNRVPLFFNVLDGSLVQYRHSPPDTMFVDIDPFVDGSRHAPGPITSLVSAVANDETVHVIYADRALFHAQRPMGLPDSFTFDTVSGRTSPEPTGSIGTHNHITMDPWIGTLHAFAYRSSAPGGAPVAENDLVHFSYDGTSWTQRTVDGDGREPDGHVAGDVGEHMATAWERRAFIDVSGDVVDNPAHGARSLHAFYVLREPEGNRLRHAEFFFGANNPRWIAETLDGSGSSTPPATPGTGPTRASVGTSPTAAWFAWYLWCIYEDQTYGNLRVARGTRMNGPYGGPLQWDFHVLDGTGRWEQTKNLVQSAVAMTWGIGHTEEHLSVFYFDQDREILRHAWRDWEQGGVTGWRYEVLDGDGGPNGRVDAPVRPAIAAIGGRFGVDIVGGVLKRKPVFVAYHWNSPDIPRWSNVRVATLM